MITGVAPVVIELETSEDGRGHRAKECPYVSGTEMAIVWELFRDMGRAWAIDSMTSMVTAWAVNGAHIPLGPLARVAVASADEIAWTLQVAGDAVRVYKQEKAEKGE